ncbi:transglutaminase-like domain-containing protein [Terrimonas sp. NA20]|uniref:Transglutaminase-like domain-containing protein n=1 Tax=Terrimonas ginsenosidimutans TaxID=2908004 RepID=A0ABS9KXV7_9BACT|nr:transglutaminase-like domain-containing protein [Terrimonas ginsenosidimutans]MCG2617072.1 transglutaminase-like domain-containing protein [Terrimonas ginsenosidimutans]
MKMILKLPILAMLLVAGICIHAQQENTVFRQFAEKQSGLFNKAYESRDLEKYHTLLDEWNAKFSDLTNEEKRKFSNYSINALYNLSCTYALLGKKQQALDYLEKSIQQGYSNYQHIQADKDLDGLRAEPRYVSMIRPLRETGDYLYILKKAGAYNHGDRRPLPAFTYQSASAPELIALQKAFNLDSVAGSGNELSKVLNLLHWVHELIPHDGNHENPVVKNAMSMIAVCKKDDRGLNCRGLATVFNEACLAVGFKSRMVTCLPKDSLGTDPDCHVINMVYLPLAKKWIWADPTNDAYVMNEKGEVLGIAEVRRSIIEGRQLILNPTANWNHRQSTTKENYLYHYMAKNLYILQCPVSSAYDIETAAAGKTIEYIQLNPLDYFRQTPDKTQRTGSQSGTTYIYYNTNNPDTFFQIP